MSDFPYVWRVRTRFPDRKGSRCRILVKSTRMNSALVEFEDGFKAVTSFNYFRLAPASAEQPALDFGVSA